jgi:ethanolamine utilization protein EutN
MLLGRVLGRVWSDRQVAGLDGHRMVIVRELETRATHVAVDLVEATAGSTVIVTTYEAAQAQLGPTPVDAVVVALVAGLEGIDDPAAMS